MKKDKASRDRDGELEALRGRVAELEATLAKLERTQAAPREGEQRCRAFLENADVTICEIDAKGVFLFANPASAETLGQKPEDVVGRTIWDVFPQDIADRRISRIRDAIRSGQAYTREMSMEVNGRLSWYQAAVRPLKDDSGRASSVLVVATDVTERRLTEQALRASEERYRVLFEAAPVGIGISDRRGKVLASNKCMDEITGYSREELGAIDLASTYVDLRQRERLLKTLKKSGKVRDFEVTLKRKDGAVYSSLLNADQIELGGEKLILTTVRDISMRKRAEQAMQESEARYHAIFAAAENVSLITTDLAGSEARITEFSPGAERIFGHKRDEIVGKPLAILHRSEDVARFPKVIDTLRRKKVGLTQQTTLVRKNREEFPALLSVYPVFDGQGKMSRVLGVSIDISELKQAEAALRESEERFRNLFEHSNDAIFIHTLDGTIQDVNHRACEMLGYEHDQLLGMPVQSLLPKEDEDASVSALRVTREGGSTRFETHLKRADGSIVDVEISSRIFDEEKGTVAGIARDITQRKRVEESLRQREQAERRFGEQLTVLHALTNELSMAGSFDELCLRAVELGRSRLGFDRMGLWFVGDKPNTVVGSFGTDAKGQTCDERAVRNRVLPGTLTEKTLEGRTRVIASLNEALLDPAGKLIAHGQRVVASLWDGQKIIGFISADNLLKGEPITDSHAELLGLYASALGHLATRKRAEENLRRSEARYRALVEQIPAVTYTAGLDEASTTTFVSPQIESLIGYTPAEYQNDRDIWRKRLHRDDRERVMAEVARAHAANERLLAEYRMIARDGREVWIHDEAETVYDDEGKPSFLLGVMYNITDRKRAEEALRESEARLRLILQHSTDGINICEMDPKTHRRQLLLCNYRFVEMSGYSREELMAAGDIGSLARALETLEEQRINGQRLRRRLPHGGRASWIRPDGRENYYEWTAAPIEVGEKLYIIGIDRDITERMRTEVALGDARRRLTTAREQERKHLAAELHDSVGQGLIALQLAMRAMSKSFENSGDTERAENAAHLCKQCDALIREIRGICRGLYPRSLELGVRAALEEVASGFQSQTNVKVNCRLPAKAGSLPADVEIALFRIAQEGITNAVRHGQAKKVSVEVGYEDEEAVLTITDDGTGFDPAKAAGRGLGLSMMQERLQTVSGTMTIDSGPKGTRICVRVPAKASAAQDN